MTNKEYGQLLRETALLIELTGGNEYRAQAFARAARTIRGEKDPIQPKIDDDAVTALSGIGDGLATTLQEISATGSFELRDNLLDQVPPGILDILRIKGVGVGKVRQLWKGLDVSSLDGLEEAARTDRLLELDGFGVRTQEKILNQIQQVRRYLSQVRGADAIRVVEPFLEELRAEGQISRAEFTGQTRRGCAVVDRAEVIVSTPAPTELAERIQSWLDGSTTVDESLERYVTVSGAVERNVPVTVYITTPAAFGTRWLETTGSQTFLRQFDDRMDAQPVAETEDALFDDVGLPFIPPELREGNGELEAAVQQALPALIQDADITGVLHNHSTYSDGAHSLEEMAQAARDRGWSYFGICDHSRSLHVANGLAVEDVKEQWQEIDELNERFSREENGDFRILKGIESDVLLDGSLDYPAHIMKGFDLVVASIHSHFNMDEAEATDRLIRAIENPYTSILGHPTGRRLLEREGYPIDHSRVLDACAENQVAVELNANPARLDLDWRWIREATERGVRIAINPDAHSVSDFDYIRWGVMVARKGWLAPSQCVNAWSLDKLLDWLQSRGQ